MICVEETTIIDHPLTAVWALIRNFNDHSRWHPIVKSSHMQNHVPPDTVGCIRDFTLLSGERVCERLLTLSDSKHSFSYSITESDIPLTHYIAHVELKPVTEGNRTFWRWWSRFNAPAGREDEFRQLVGEGVYRGGFNGAREYLAADTVWPHQSDQSRALSAGNAADPPVATDDVTDDPACSARYAARPAKLDTNAISSHAVSVIQYGGADVLTPVVHDVGAPTSGEVRIQQQAIGVNYIDVYTRTGYFNLITPPAIPGMEGSGTVIDVGSSVTHLRPGDRVCYACAPPGAYTAFRTLAAELVIAIPESIDFDTAAALCLKGVTAYFLLHKVHQLRAGETALIFAPAGGVGRLLVEWANHLGATVIGATSTHEKAAIAKAAGARHVIQPGLLSLEQQISTLTGGQGADVVFDAVGKDSFQHSMAALKNGGHLVSFGQASGDIGHHDIGAMAANSLTLSRPNYSHYTDTREKMTEALDAVWAALGSGVITCNIGQRYPLESAAQAHQALESRKTTGSTLLIPRQS